MHSEYLYLFDTLKMFVLFLRKHQIKDYLQLKHQEIELELTRLIRIANRLTLKRDKKAPHWPEAGVKKRRDSRMS